MDGTVESLEVPHDVSHTCTNKRNTDSMYDPVNNFEWVSGDEEEEIVSNSQTIPLAPVSNESDQPDYHISSPPAPPSPPGGPPAPPSPPGGPPAPPPPPEDQRSTQDDASSTSSLFGHSTSNVDRYLQRMTRRVPSLAISVPRAGGTGESLHLDLKKKYGSIFELSSEWKYKKKLFRSPLIFLLMLKVHLQMKGKYLKIISIICEFFW